MRIGPAANVGRINVAENVSALWTFAHANGISLDDIIERTAAAGVTIDGLLVKDSGIPEAAVTAHEAALSIAGTQIPSLPVALVTAHEAALVILLSQIVDIELFARLADAESIVGLWTFISGVNVSGALDLSGDLELSERTVVLGAGANDDVATGIETVQRLDADTNGANLITGFAGGRAGRMILVVNIGTTDSPTLAHEHVGSVAANRLLLPLEAGRTLSSSGGAWFMYDDAVSRWRMVRTI